MSKQEETFEAIYAEISEKLIDDFKNLESLQQYFIEVCSKEGNLLFIENLRFSDEEQDFSNTYKIKKTLTKVLDLEYEEDMSFTSKPGSTYSSYAIIAIPKNLEIIITQINSLKHKIREVLAKTANNRFKSEGKLIGLNKMILRRIGKPRANMNQVRRNLNFISDIYTQISLSCTKQRPIYKKSYSDVMKLLTQYESQQASIDIQTLKNYSHIKEFAFFYEEVYDSMVANLKYKADIDTNERGEVLTRKFKSMKVSSPIYILCDNPFDSDITIKHKIKKNSESYNKRVSTIKQSPILQSIPIHLYL